MGKAYKPLLPGSTTPGAPIVLTIPSADLVAAVIARLRQWNGGELVALFGETAAQPKFWSDVVLGSPAFPWARITELDAPAEQEMVGASGVPHYYPHGEIQVSVFAPKKIQARTLRRRIYATLNDAPLPNNEGFVLAFRALHDDSPIVPEIAFGVPQCYHAAGRFAYFMDRPAPILAGDAIATQPDVAAAIAAQLRAYDGGSFAAALGDTALTPKIWIDVALGSPALPYVQVIEREADSGQEMPDADGTPHYYPAGEYELVVYARTKIQARTLRRTLSLALNDAPLVNDDAAVLMFRVKNDSAPPTPESGLGVPQTYRASAVFGLIADRVIT